jgi:hypothetical protein
VDIKEVHKAYNN